MGEAWISLNVTGGSFMTDRRLQGRTALVTGASSGLGRSFAKILAGAGARVAVGARRKELLDDLVREIEAEYGEAFALDMDVVDTRSVEHAYSVLSEHWAAPDVVVANAGISVGGRAVDIPAEQWDKILSVNVKGAFLTAREGAKGMLARATDARSPEGRIILVASVLGHNPMAGLSPYCSSKAAVEMMGRCLSREWAHYGINVNVLCPGYVETELNSGWFSSEKGKRQVDGFPRKRLMHSEDMSDLLIYLSSDGSKAITGSVITIDDGQI